MSVTMHATSGGLALQFPYDPGLVAALKSTVPSSARRWDNGRKIWLVETAYGQQVANLVYQMTGQRVAVPQTASLLTNAPEVRLLQVEYIGRCKEVAAGLADARASGYADGDWSVTFPEKVLRDWFDFGPGDPTNGTPRRPASLYTALGLPNDADDTAIKAGYRRMVKITHPDVDREQGAADRFRAVQHAYDVLSDRLKRRKYDAGLAFEASMQSPQASPYSSLTGRNNDQYGYRSPLRCGWILAEGAPGLRGFIVSKILAWRPITDAQGRELVTSWIAGATTFERQYV